MANMQYTPRVSQSGFQVRLPLHVFVTVERKLPRNPAQRIPASFGQHLKLLSHEY